MSSKLSKAVARNELKKLKVLLNDHKLTYEQYVKLKRKWKHLLSLPE